MSDAPGSEPPPGWAEMGWRERMTAVAEFLWDLHLRHPWVLRFQTHRPIIGPNTTASDEVALSAVDGIGLDAIEMDLAITGLADLVVGTVRNAARARVVEEATGMGDEAWWRAIEPFMATVDFTPYPATARVAPVTGAEHGAGDPRRTFEFALARYLDGMEAMLARKAAGNV